MPAPFPNIGPKRPLSQLEQEMEIDYVEDTCGWCGAHLIVPEAPIYPEQLICLNACHLPMGTFNRLQQGLQEAWNATRNKEGE